MDGDDSQLHVQLLYTLDRELSGFHGQPGQQCAEEKYPLHLPEIAIWFPAMQPTAEPQYQLSYPGKDVQPTKLSLTHW
jgi:hypothetical protein